MAGGPVAEMENPGLPDFVPPSVSFGNGVNHKMSRSLESEAHFGRSMPDGTSNKLLEISADLKSIVLEAPRTAAGGPVAEVENPGLSELVPPSISFKSGVNHKMSSTTESEAHFGRGKGDAT